MRSEDTASDFQMRFHQQWQALEDPHVRSLAWLLYASDLLNPSAAKWQGKIASLPVDAAMAAFDWLLQLNHSPLAFHQYLDVQRFTRLGRYAEKLLAWYFDNQQILVAHGVQVRAGKDETIGEFDFLLRLDDALVHWEFATKFYLLHTGQSGLAVDHTADYFVGPNLADTLGAKMRKILERQLSLGKHPAAQQHLPQSLSAAQALIRGWLFYRKEEIFSAADLGISPQHCRGWWCSLQELDTHAGEINVILPRLSWLAPARMELSKGVTKFELQTYLAQHFVKDSMPVMIAAMVEKDGWLWETERGFVVPDDWQQKADCRLQGLQKNQI
jgi:hypothetical protein